MSETLDESGLLGEARALVDRAAQDGLALRLVGGLAIRLLTPELPPRTRTGQDLDFATRKADRRALGELLAAQGYAADRTFNALYGDRQLYFANPESGIAIDVLVDKLAMCHTLEFAPRLTRLPYTLDPLDLLLSKLQIVELNEKDADDCLRLLASFPLADSAEPPSMDLQSFRALVGDDWGWWRTVTLNLERIAALLADGARPALAGGRLDPDAQLATLARAAEEAPKSRRWKRRARVGERKRWYEQPEETPHD